jgi:hypothetical protein
MPVDLPHVKLRFAGGPLPHPLLSAAVMLGRSIKFIGSVAAVPVGQVYEVELGAEDDVAEDGGIEDDVARALALAEAEVTEEGATEAEAKEGIDDPELILVATDEVGADDPDPDTYTDTDPVPVPVCTATPVTQTTFVEVDSTVVEVVLVTVTVE